jgi:hypothetical protein
MRTLCYLVAALVVTAAAPAVAGPVVHGYGTHGCPQFLDTYKGWEAGDEQGILDFFGYEQWLAGLVSGLSLATGEDALRGVDVEGLMRRIKLRCEDDRDLDVMGAAMAHVAELSPLR